MVSPFSGWVLGGAALLSSPAWYAALVAGTLPVETAATRAGIALLIAWVGLSMLHSLVQGTSPAPAPSEPVTASLPGIDGPLPVRPAGIDPPGPS